MSCDAVIWEGARTLRVIDSPIEFGRQGIIFTGKKTKKSISSPGEKAIMVGYAGDLHSSDTYYMYKPRTNKVVTTKDVRWEEWHGDKSDTSHLFDEQQEQRAVPNREEDAPMGLEGDAMNVAPVVILRQRNPSWLIVLQDPTHHPLASQRVV